MQVVCIYHNELSTCQNADCHAVTYGICVRPLHVYCTALCRAAAFAYQLLACAFVTGHCTHLAMLRPPRFAAGMLFGKGKISEGKRCKTVFAAQYTVQDPRR